MDGQPVTLQGRDERADLAFCTRKQGGQSKGDGCQGSGDNAEGPLVISDIHNEIDQDNGPGEEYKGFIDIGKGDISVTGGVTFTPANQEPHQVDEKTSNDNAEGNCAHLLLFCRYKKQIAQKGDDIDKHGGVKKVRIIHC